MKRPYIEESTRVLNLCTAHEKRHGCKGTDCEISHAYALAFMGLLNAERPLRALFEGLRIVALGVPCSSGCGLLTIPASWRKPGDECFSCWNGRQNRASPPEVRS